MSDAHQVIYLFTLPDHSSFSFNIDVNRPASFSAPNSAPDWTLLEYNKCKACPLTRSCTHCPAAVDVAPILFRFAHIPSFERVSVRVKTANRNCSVDTDAQGALKAVLGLVMASSACPLLGRLRSQALFHLPFASLEETLYRTVGDYLIKQYFIMKRGGRPDFDLKGLDTLYQDITALNLAFYKRIEAAGSGDANVSAIVTLRSLSDIVSITLEDRLAELGEAMQEPS